MIIWLLIVLLATMAIMLVVRPLFLNWSSVGWSTAAELAVYRDQLSELEEDQSRGLISAEDAEAVRAEVARRLLRQAHEVESADVRSEEVSGTGEVFSSWNSSGLAILISVLIGAASIGIYLLVGAPGLDGSAAVRASRPIAAGSDKEDAVALLVGKVEEQLRKKPDDGRGWDVIAPVYFDLRRYDDAVLAYGRALSLLGESPQRQAGLARSLLRSNQGVVTERARKAYVRLLALEPDNVEAQLWLARAREQDGDEAGALTTYRKLLESAVNNEALKKLVQERISVLEKSLPEERLISERSPQSEEGKGGKKEQRATDGGAIGTLTPFAGGQTVNEMVAGLAKRLSDDGSDFDGWLRLIRSYSVLGRKDDARHALSKAQTLFAGDEKRQGTLKQLADKLKLVKSLGKQRGDD